MLTLKQSNHRNLQIDKASVVRMEMPAPFTFPTFVAICILFAIQPQRTSAQSGELPNNPHPNGAFVSRQTVSPLRNIGSGNTTIARVQSGKLVQSNCSVFAINEVTIPARKSGMLLNLGVGLDSEVKINSIVGNLDDADETLESRAMQVQIAAARQSVADNSQTEFAKLKIETAKAELLSIRESERRGTASERDLRERSLAVKQAELELVQATQTQKQRKLDLDLKLAEFEIVKQKLSRTKLVAPIDGLVTKLHRKQGEWVQTGEPIIDIIGLEKLRVDFFVDIRDVAPAKLIGKRVTVRSDSTTTGEQSVFVGTVARYTRSVTAKGIVRIQAEIQNQRAANHSDWKLLPGMTVSIEIDNN